MTEIPKRAVRLVRPLTGGAAGVVALRTRGSTNYYAVQEIPCAIGGRGFAVHRLGLGDLYHVRVGRRDECSCECLGFLRHGHCKHVSGLLALIRHRLV